MHSPAEASLQCPNGHGAFPSSAGSNCPQCGAWLVPAPYGAAAIPPSTPAPYAPPPGIPGGYSPPAPPYVPQGYVPPQPYPPQGHAPPVHISGQPAPCEACGGDGSRLAPETVTCPKCRWLRPLAPGYYVDPSAFMWAQDGAAMAKLRSIGPLNAAAKAVSDKVGRRWIESTFNGVRLGENQLPHIWEQAIRAARILGMPTMPEVYVTGDKMWEAATYGSDRSSFILVGTALVNSFRGDDLLFVLAREMGHCRVGHALWKTVGAFLMGMQGPRAGMMSQGVLAAALNPEKLLTGAIEMPFLAWARQSEITADRAGLLAVGDEEIARRVLLSWSLRSSALYQQINVDAWLQQQEDSDDGMTRLAQMLSSPTPYITRRLRTLAGFAQGPELAQMRAVIAPLVPPGPAPQPARRPAAPAKDALRLSCSGCGAPMSVPRSALDGRQSLNVKCANPACGKITPLRKKGASAARLAAGAAPTTPAPPATPPAGATSRAAAPALARTPAAPSAPAPAAAAGLDLAMFALPRRVPAPASPPPQARPGGAEPAPAAPPTARLSCPSCRSAMRVPRSVLEGEGTFKVRCPKAECGKVLTLRRAPAAWDRNDPEG